MTRSLYSLHTCAGKCSSAVNTEIPLPTPTYLPNSTYLLSRARVLGPRPRRPTRSHTVGMRTLEGVV